MDHGKKYIVTGGSKGIGRAIVALLLRRGCRVLTLARSEAGLEGLAEAMRDHGYRGLETLTLDVSDLDAVRTTFKECAFLTDGIDGLVCNAAYQHLDHALRIPMEEIEKTIRVNALSPILTMQCCYPALQQRQGAIVYIGSVSDTAYAATYAAYGASKAYMNSYLRHAAKDTGEDGVRVTLVSPGATDTPMLAKVLGQIGEEPQQVAAKMPMKRFGRPEEVAEAVLFALEGPQYFHGDDLRIHGGIV